jgi:hypothetical protein
VKQLLLVLSLAWLGACHEEPPIVIKFEPMDGAASHPASTVLVDAAARSSVDGSAAHATTDGGAAHAAAEAGATKGHVAPTTDGGKGLPAVAAGGACKTADDCLVVPVECCDCANGGKQQAANKQQAKAIAASREKSCKNAMCTMMISTDPSCGMRANCVSGKCVMEKKK